MQCWWTIVFGCWCWIIVADSDSTAVIPISAPVTTEDSIELPQLLSLITNGVAMLYSQEERKESGVQRYVSASATYWYPRATGSERYEYKAEYPRKNDLAPRGRKGRDSSSSDFTDVMMPPRQSRITPKAIFIAPRLRLCPVGEKQDHGGTCRKDSVSSRDFQNQLILEKLQKFLQRSQIIQAELTGGFDTTTLQTTTGDFSTPDDLAVTQRSLGGEGTGESAARLGSELEDNLPLSTTTEATTYAPTTATGGVVYDTSTTAAEVVTIPVGEVPSTTVRDVPSTVVTEVPASNQEVVSDDQEQVPVYQVTFDDHQQPTVLPPGPFTPWPNFLNYNIDRFYGNRLPFPNWRFPRPRRPLPPHLLPPGHPRFSHEFWDWWLRATLKFGVSTSYYMSMGVKSNFPNDFFPGD